MYRKTLTLLLTLILIHLATGCDNKQLAQLNVGTNVWPGYEPLHLAAVERAYPEPVSVTQYDSATDVLNAYRQGTIQAAALTLDETILLKDQGYTPVVIGIMDISEGADVIMAKPSITSIAQLKGKTIGVENSALGSYVLARVLELAGLEGEEVNVLPVSVDDHEAAYKDGVVDAVITFEPVRSELLKAGASEIFSSKEIPNEIVDVLIIDKAYLDTPHARALLQGWAVASAQIIQQEPDAMNMVAARLGQTREEFLLSLDGLKIPSPKEVDRMFEDGTLLKTINQIKSVMLKKELIKQDFSSAELLSKQ
jgi:NitT/TauT family transport system substrate-binding protein